MSNPHENNTDHKRSSQTTSVIEKSEARQPLMESLLVLPENLSSVRVTRSKGKTGTKKVIHANPIRLGKDEMNLIEHPFAVLYQKEPENAVIAYEWDARHPKTGKLLPASWMVAGHREHGLPTSTEERVYLVLLELTREAGFNSPVVHFSRYDIIQRLGWQASPRSYEMLKLALARLQGVTINAQNAFWNPKSNSYRNTAFNIIDFYDTNAEPPGRKSAQRELPLSYFKWSDILFDSFQSGYIRTLDLDFALSLKGDIALRLYRYLDKKSYDGRAEFEIEMLGLCIEHLGMKPSPYPSKLKERLKPAHEELTDKGFLHEVSYETMKNGKDVKVRYRFCPRQAIAETSEEQKTLEDGTAQSSTQSVEETPTTYSVRGGLEAQMRRLGVTPETIADFLENVSAQELQNQLDYLDDRKPKDRAAVFVKSVRESWTPPAKYTQRLSSQKTREDARTTQAAKNQRKAQEEAAKRQENADNEVDATHLDTLWEEIDYQTRDEIEMETRDRLGVLFLEGKNSAAFNAMRREIQREIMNNAVGKEK